MRQILSTFIILFTLSSCQKQQEQTTNEPSKAELQKTLDTHNQSLVDAAKSKNFDAVSDLYLDDALVLAEYNPIIDGKAAITKFYTNIFESQDIADYQKATTELFDFEKIVLEIGSFSKTFDDDQSQEGKYFNVWKKSTDGILQLQSETFGYYHTIDDPATLRIETEDKSTGLRTRQGKIVPTELEKLDARNEDHVRDRNTKGVVEGYTQDGAYYPFADTIKSGQENLLTHYTDYHRNPVTIDSIDVWTYDFEVVDDGIIKYSRFYVEWAVPDFSGSTEGTGLIYYRRQADNSLKVHRQIGLHTFKE